MKNNGTDDDGARTPTHEKYQNPDDLGTPNLIARANSSSFNQLKEVEIFFLCLFQAFIVAPIFIVYRLFSNPLELYRDFIHDFYDHSPPRESYETSFTTPGSNSSEISNNTPFSRNEIDFKPIPFPEMKGLEELNHDKPHYE